MHDISLVRLDTGEFLLATVEGPITMGNTIAAYETYILKKPMQIIPRPSQSPQGGMDIALGDYPPFAEHGDLPMLGIHIMFIAQPDKKLIETYQRANSKIITPPSAIRL
jgi:hypothetical protein